MNVIRYRPWSLHDELNGVLNSLTHSYLRPASDHARAGEWLPSVEIREETDRFVILADLPGIKPDDIDVTMQDHTLTITGKRERESENKDYVLHRNERSFGHFSRSFQLPATADSQAVQARGQNGVLAIVVPKKAEAKPKKIEVTQH